MNPWVDTCYYLSIYLSMGWFTWACGALPNRDRVGASRLFHRKLLNTSLYNASILLTPLIMRSWAMHSPPGLLWATHPKHTRNSFWSYFVDLFLVMVLHVPIPFEPMPTSCNSKVKQTKLFMQASHRWITSDSMKPQIQGIMAQLIRHSLWTLDIRGPLTGHGSIQ